MGKFKDLTGLKFGRLTVIERASNSKRGDARWHCICDCGKERVVQTGNLGNGHTQSCGCLHKEIMSSVKTIHGYGSRNKPVHPLYTAWKSIKNRCYSQKNSGYKNYGGRGITIWPKWKTSPENFITWCCSNGWKKGLEIDRRNNNKGYYPENCRFVTPIINTHNRRLLRSDNTTGFCGVSKDKNRYASRTRINGCRHYLGSFETPEEAAVARDEFVKIHAPEMPLNFPELREAVK